MPHSYLILKLELLHKDWIQRLLNQFHYPPLCRQGIIFRLLYSNDHFKTFLTWLCIHSSSLGLRPRNSITSGVAWVGRYRHKKGRIRQKHSSLQTRPLHAAPLWTTTDDFHVYFWRLAHWEHGLILVCKDEEARRYPKTAFSRLSVQEYNFGQPNKVGSLKILTCLGYSELSLERAQSLSLRGKWQ